MIVFLRSSLIDNDPRVQRYLSALHGDGMPTESLVWDRSSTRGDSEHVSYFRHASPVGAGFANAWNLLRWNWFCFRQLWCRRSSIQVVHAVDLDTGVAAIVFRLLTGIPVVYDAFDKYSASRATRPWVAAVLDGVERWVMRKASHVLLPDEGRRVQHGVEALADVTVIENVPMDMALDRSPMRKMPQKPVVLAYAGALAAQHRGLEDLLAWVASHQGEVALDVAGAGVLEGLCRDMAACHSNIRFHGALGSVQALALMARADVIVGFYYLSSPNHRFAAPNKYFEHLMLGRPLLTTRDTPPGDKVAQHGTGWAIPCGLSALDAWWLDFQWEDAVRKANAAAGLWDREYSGYFRSSLQGRYVQLMKAWAP